MIEIADPERALAVAYAPAARRPALAALFALDERMAGIVASARETTIGLIRLAWWREALERLDGQSAPAEPLLQALAALPALGVSGSAISGIEEGWAALFDDPTDDAAMIRHAQARGATLFVQAGQILAGRTLDAPLAIAGEGWALADLGHRHSVPGVRQRARELAMERLAAVRMTRWPRPLRPLGMLAVLARSDAALAGARTQGAPKRILRMLALRVIGR